MADNIWIRASDGDLERVKHLVEVEGIAPDAGDSFGYTPVHAAASHGHPELLDYLLKKGANPNVPDNDGDRPLHYCETEEAAQMLIAAGADPTITNGDGVTPLENAVEEGWEDVAKYLARHLGLPEPEIVDAETLAAQTMAAYLLADGEVDLDAIAAAIAEGAEHAEDDDHDDANQSSN